MALPNERYAQYGQGTFERTRSKLAEAAHGTEDLVRENPAVSALVTFGVGFGLGFLLTTLLLPSRKRSWYDSYAPEGMSARQMRKSVRDTVSQILPEALSRYL